MNLFIWWLYSGHVFFKFIWLNISVGRHGGALSPHIKKVPGSIPGLFPPCLCPFSPSTLASSYHQKQAEVKFSLQKTHRCECECECLCIFFRVALEWAGNLPRMQAPVQREMMNKGTNVPVVSLGRGGSTVAFCNESPTLKCLSVSTLPLLHHGIRSMFWDNCQTLCEWVLEQTTVHLRCGLRPDSHREQCRWTDEGQKGIVQSKTSI